MGCCADSVNTCTPATACMDYSAVKAGRCENLGPETACCGKDGPYCWTWTFADTKPTYTGVWCRAQKPPARVLAAQQSPALGTTTTTTVQSERRTTGQTSESTATQSTATGSSTSSSTVATPESTGKVGSSKEGGDEGGFSLSDKIALGCGIGIGAPAAIAAIWTCLFRR